MQPVVSRAAPVARPPLRVVVPRALGSGRCRLRLGRAEAPTTLRARFGGGAEPVDQMRKDGGALGEEEDARAVMAPEELEMLEDEAMGGCDEGRRPTDYDRRAHIFEESSRVFRALKQRRDGHDGAKAGAATAEATRDRHKAQPHLE